MRILGIDPGSRHTGYGVVELHGDELEPLDWGRLSCPPREPVPQRLARLAAGLEELLGRWQPDAAVLETPFHGLNARSLVVLAQARGALLAVLAGRRVPIHEYSPAEVKSAVTGHGRADKRQMARMVGLQLALPEEAGEDAADALALALCFARRRRLDRLAGTSRAR